MSADPVAANGPLRYTDSTGRCIDDCTSWQTLMILNCGFNSNCGFGDASTADLHRLSLWVMRQSGFGSNTRDLANIYHAFDRAVRDVRRVIQFRGQSPQLRLDDSLAFHVAEDLTPYLSHGRGTGRVDGYDVSISYLDIRIEALAKRSAHMVTSWPSSLGSNSTPISPSRFRRR